MFTYSVSDFDIAVETLRAHIMPEGADVEEWRKICEKYVRVEYMPAMSMLGF
jgi:hypothetical protein